MAAGYNVTKIAWIKDDEAGMKKIYLVDSENVGDLWVTHILALAEEEDEIVVFYTQKSPHMGYDTIRKLLADGREVDFVKCVEGKNALDFQLVTELGYRLGGQKEECEYIMVTNDTGFDAVVQYWKNAGKQVKRYNAKYCQNQYNKKMVEEEREKLAKQLRGNLSNLEVVEQESQTEEPDEKMMHKEPVFDIVLKEYAETKENEQITEAEQKKQRQPKRAKKEEPLKPSKVTSTVTEEETTKTVEEIKVAETLKEKEDAKTSVSVDASQNTKQEKETVKTEPVQDEELLKELVNCLGINNSGEIHNALTMFLGDEGKTVYQKNKSNLKEFVEKKQLKIQDKFKVYCQLVFERSEQKEAYPKNFSNFVYGAKDKRKNLNSFRSALQKEYGKEKGMQYYTLIKPHVKILNKIQK